MSSILYSPVLGYIQTLNDFLLSPILSCPLLLTAIYAPEVANNALSSLAARLPPQISTTLDLPTVNKVLLIWTSLSVLRTINKVLNVMAHNSWRLRPASNWSWTNEIAVVTGGSSGIGLSMVQKLSGLGIRVAVFDVQDLPKELQADSRVHFYRCDITTVESVAEAADAVRRELGHPTILINNAGITSPMPILKMSESFLRKIMGVNLMSLWYTTQQFLPRMIQLNKGHIITVASIASFVALPTGADYSASKAGALSFHESLASELKHFYKAPNVLTTVVHPNFVRTPLVEGFAEKLERGGVKFLTPDDIANEVVAQIKRKRGGQIIVPKSASGISGIRGWPTWIQELLRDVIGKTA